MKEMGSHQTVWFNRQQETAVANQLDGPLYLAYSPARLLHSGWGAAYSAMPAPPPRRGLQAWWPAGLGISFTRANWAIQAEGETFLTIAAVFVGWSGDPSHTELYQFQKPFVKEISNFSILLNRQRVFSLQIR